MMFCFSIEHAYLTQKPTATKTATKRFWLLENQEPTNHKPFRIIWCREGGSNPHEVALGGF
jgi:hypothetical protein